MINKFAKFYQGCKGNIPSRNIESFDFTKDGPYLVEEKYDGIWCAIVFDELGNVSLMSRNQKEKTNAQLQSLIDYIKETFQLRNTVLAGELAFGTQAGTDYAKKYGHHKIDLFDVLVNQGDILFEKPLTGRKNVLNRLFLIATPHKEWIVEAPYIITKSVKQVQNWYDGIFARKGEGLIVKDTTDREYIRGGKSKLWYKIKKVVDMDYVIMGYKETQSAAYKKKGYIGGVIGGLFEEGILVEKVDIGSMSDWWRKEFMDNKNKYLGEVMECNGFEVFKSGSLRHPSFGRIRDDKNAEECVWPI